MFQNWTSQMKKNGKTANIIYIVGKIKVFLTKIFENSLIKQDTHLILIS